MFRLCSNCVLTVRDLSFSCARPIFWQCSTYVLIFSTKIGYFSAFLTYVLTLTTKIVFQFSRPMFRPSRPMFWLSRPKTDVSLCARLKVAFRPLNFSRKTALARLSKSKISRVSKSKNKSSTSTREVYLFCVIKLPFKIFEQIMVFLTNFKNY